MKQIFLLASAFFVFAFNALSQKFSPPTYCVVSHSNYMDNYITQSILLQDGTEDTPIKTTYWDGGYPDKGGYHPMEVIETVQNFTGDSITLVLTSKRKDVQQALNYYLWIDWNFDGDFTDANEYISVRKNSKLNVNRLSFFVPKSQPLGYAAYRVTMTTLDLQALDAVNFSCIDPAGDGETENHLLHFVETPAAKFNYCNVTHTNTQNGYINRVEPTPKNEGYTGISSSYSSTGYKDLSGIPLGVFYPNDNASLYMIPTRASSSTRYYYYLFFDWNHDGDFNDEEESKRSFSDLDAAIGVSLGFSFPENIVTIPDTFTVRIRMTPMFLFNANITDPACLSNIDGYTQDYRIVLKNPTVTALESELSLNKINQNGDEIIIKNESLAPLTINISSIDGRLLASRTSSDSEIFFDIESFQQGLYMINITTENARSINKKILKN